MIKKYLFLSSILVIPLLFISPTFAEDLATVAERLRFPTGNTLEPKILTMEEKVKRFTDNGKQEVAVDLNYPVIHYKMNDTDIKNYKAYAEIKDGLPYEERFEVMGGVPSREDFSITWGAENGLQADLQGYVLKSKSENNSLNFSFSASFLPYYTNLEHYAGSENMEMNHCQVEFRGPGASSWETFCGGEKALKSLKAAEFEAKWNEYVKEHFGRQNCKENKPHEEHDYNCESDDEGNVT